MIERKKLMFRLFMISFTLLCCFSQSDDDIIIQEYQNQENEPERYAEREVQDQSQGSNFAQSENAQRQMQYMSQKRTACLVLSRYYTNQLSEDINSIVKGLVAGDQQKYINKLYATAVEYCEPKITQMEVYQFFTPTQNFDPSPMYYIFDRYDLNEATKNFDELSQNQNSIVKFIKQFDSEMQVRKEEEQAKKVQQQRDEGIQVFFVSMKNLSPKMKFMYIGIVVLISGALLWYGFSQLGKKPEKNKNKRRKKN